MDGRAEKENWKGGRSRFEGKAEGEHWSKGKIGVEGYNDDGVWKGRRKEIREQGRRRGSDGRVEEEN